MDQGVMSMNVVALSSVADQPVTACLARALFAEAMATEDLAVSLLDLTSDDGPTDQALFGGGTGRQNCRAMINAYRDILVNTIPGATDVVLLNLPSFVLRDRHELLMALDLVILHVPAGTDDGARLRAAARYLRLLNKPYFFVISEPMPNDERAATLALQLLEEGRIATSIVPETPALLENHRAPLLSDEDSAHGAAVRSIRGLWQYTAQHIRYPDRCARPVADDYRVPPEKQEGQNAFRNVTILYNDRRFGCFTVDVSATGMGFLCNIPVECGERLAIDIPGVGRLIGKVRHAQGYHIGVEFIIPGRQHLQAVLKLSNLILHEDAPDDGGATNPAWRHSDPAELPANPGLAEAKRHERP